MYKYKFVSTAEDLLEAEEAERTAHSARMFFRWMIILLGITWLVAGVLAFDWSDQNWRPFIWFLLGIGIIYYFAIKPFLQRNRIRKSNKQQQNLTLEFHNDSIKLNIEGVGEFNRNWDELIQFINTEKGIIFYFNDNVVNWLPRRVFSDQAEKDSFINFLQSRQR